MKEKSHRGRRHMGCGICKFYKRIGNGAERRSITEPRHLLHDRYEGRESPVDEARP